MDQIKIPGYEAELSREQYLRDEAFVGGSDLLCGISVYQITPYLLAKLRCIRSPFVCGGVYTEIDTIRFLWVISKIGMGVEKGHPEHKERLDAMTDLLLTKYGQHFLDAEKEIDEFIKVTFMDGPRGGVEAVPYVTGTAWMIYVMSKEPFRWTKDQTIHTPYRELYQYVRCKRLDEGGILFNEFSDTIKADWLAEIRNQRN